MLRGVELRVTRPRVAVLSAVHDHPHADTDSIIGVVRDDLGEVSHQAVYDVLRALTAVGLLRRIQPEPIQVKFIDPIADVLNEELSNRGGIVAVKIDRVAPIVLVAVGEVRRRESAQIVS